MRSWGVEASGIDESESLRNGLGFAEVSLLGMMQKTENACLRFGFTVVGMLVPMLCVDTSDTSEATDDE